MYGSVHPVSRDCPGPLDNVASSLVKSITCHLDTRYHAVLYPQHRCTEAPSTPSNSFFFLLLPRLLSFPSPSSSFTFSYNARDKSQQHALGISGIFLPPPLPPLSSVLDYRDVWQSLLEKKNTGKETRDKNRKKISKDSFFFLQYVVFFKILIITLLKSNTRCNPRVLE